MDTYAATGQAHNRLAFSTTFNNTDSEKMTILDSGNVGIGHTSPEATLQVMGDTTISGSDSSALDLFVRNHHGTGLSRIIAQNNNVDMNAQLVADDANNVASVGSSTGGSKFIKFVGGTTNAYFDGGNFGIGAETPAVQLHIQDSQSDTDFTNNSVVGGSSIIISNQQQTDNTFSSLQFIAKESGGNDQSAAIVVESTSATDYSPKLHIVQRRAANTQVPRLTIDESGKLGIGNTTPTKTLTVAGEISGSGTGHFANITLARTETIAVNNGNLYYTGGNLGIGTTVPVSTLTIGGAAGILSFNGTHGGGGEGIQYEDSGGTLRYAVNFPGSDVVAISNRAANGVVQIRANTTTAGSSGEKTIAEFRDNQVIFDQGSSTGNLFEFQNSNVNHPMTDEESADVYGTIRPASGTAGGLRLKGLRDSGGSNHSALRLSGFLGESANTSKSTSGHGVVRVDASQTDGTTEVTSLVANGNLFSISNDGSTKFIVDEDGDVHIDGGYSAYDSYDDAMLIRAISTTTTPKAIIQNQFDKYVKYNERTLVDAGLLGEVTEDEKKKGVKPLINSTGLQKLHNGAIWQQYSEMQQMKELMYETMVEMIGKEAADKKLEKHGLKLLRELDG